MGSYCQLYICDYPVYESKSSVFPLVMSMFRESDKRVYDRYVKDRNHIQWDEIDSKDDEREVAIEYRALAKHARDRLEISGFNLSRVIREFSEAKSTEIEKLTKWAEDDDHDLWSETINLLKSTDFADYLEAFHIILNSGTHPSYYVDENPDSSELIHFILEHNTHFYWGFPCLDFRCFLRTLLEIAPDESYVIQDVTDLVHAGLYDAADSVCHLALDELIGDYQTSAKIIVLTEGITDTEILRGTLDLLYPHLSDLR